MSSEHLASLSPRCGKIVVCVTEDWFLLSHFRPLVATLRTLAREVVIVTRSNGHIPEVERLGVRVVLFDWRRGAIRPLADTATALRLARVIRNERPDVIHAIALKPIALTMLARRLSPRLRLVMHLTGVGYAGTVGTGTASRAVRLVQSLMARQLAARGTHLMAENPDDIAEIASRAHFPAPRATMLPGAGIDPAAYPPSDLPDGDPPVCGFIGRLIWSKGVDVLVAAHALLKTRGVRLKLLIGGTPDAENPMSVTAAELETWGRDPDIELLGRVTDIPAFWRRCDFSVTPSRGGEGLPRALLESASSARAAIVSDVPGCRHLVRDGIEGFLVPPGDAQALATALERLATGAGLRRRLGLAARARLLDSFTVTHVEQGIRDAYAHLLATAPAA